MTKRKRKENLLERFCTVLVAATLLLPTGAGVEISNPTSRTICHFQHPPQGNKRRLMKKWTRSKLRTLYSSGK
jgi:hypothetical protein